MRRKVVIVGAGFTGLSIGLDVTVHEKEDVIGGLAATFETDGQKLERFYHHWFTNDQNVMTLIKDLAKESSIRIRNTNTGMYYANNFYKLSSLLKKYVVDKSYKNIDEIIMKETN